MNTAIKRVVSICLMAALLFSVGTTALTAQADETNPAQANSDIQVDENGDVIVHYDESLVTGAQEVEIDDLENENTIETVEEYKEYADIEEAPAPKKRSALKAGATGANLPDAVDNSQNENSIYFPAIRSQGGIGSCVAWSTAYYQYTYMANRARGVATTDDNTYSPMWTYNFCNHGRDKGSWCNWTYESLKRMGAVTINEVPIKTSTYPETNYLDWHADDDTWEHALHNRITSYAFFTSTTDYGGYVVETTSPVSETGTPITDAKDSDLDAIKTALSNGEILSIQTCINSWQYKVLKYSSNPGVDNSYVGKTAAYVCNGYEGPHQMTMVGYNDNIWVDINNNNAVDNGEMGAFRIANSWGTWNGDNGYYWVAYDSLNKVTAVPGLSAIDGRHTIFGTVSSIKVENKDYASGLNLRYVLNSANRAETVITVKAAAKNGSGTYTQKVNPYSMEDYYYISYDKSYAGTVNASDGEMYYDLNCVVPGISLSNINDYNWTITITDKLNDDVSLAVKELEFVDSTTGATQDVLSGQQFTLNGNSKQYVVSNVDLNTIFEADVTVTPQKNFGIAEIAKIKVQPRGGVAPYTYKYEMTRYGQTSILSDWTTSTEFDKQLYEVGPYYFTVTAKDSLGNTAPASASVNVNTTYLLKLNANRETANKGETVIFTPETLNLASVINANDFHYTVTKDGQSQSFYANSDKTFTWTPSEAGDYTIKCEIIYNSMKIADKTVNYTVSDNSTTIYYKGYSAPYIHYQVGNGSWTAVPGVRMTATNELSGYTHKYTINLGSASYANVCFNNGSGSWDSNNGANYRFEAGYYKYSNGVKTKFTPTPAELTAKVEFDASEYVKLRPLTFGVSGVNGKTPYTYKLSYVFNGVEYIMSDYSERTQTSFTPGISGTYTLKAYVKDATGKIAVASKQVAVKEPILNSVNANSDNIKAGQSVKLSMDVTQPVSGLVYKYEVSSASGTTVLTTNSDKTAAWTPNAAGTYTITGSLVFYGSVYTSKTLTVNVAEAPANNAVIYYKGYSAPYIHYQVGNGSWTAVPGVKMTATSEVSGYTHKYTINLGSASYANVCFNNGSGNWDSNNGANYRFQAGYYKYSNGTITKFDPTPAGLTASVSLSAVEEYIGEIVNVNATAANGTAPYQYNFKFVRDDGSALETGYDTKSSTTYGTNVPGGCKVTVTVKDATGKTAEASRTFTMKSPAVTAVNTSLSNASVGQTVKLTLGVTDSMSALTYRYEVTKNGVKTTLTTASDKSANWTPNAAGEYTVTGSVVYKGNVISSKSITYNVANAPANSITIYYKGYANPNIHYQVGTGSWTNVPGVRMTATNEVSGFTHKYTINLGSASYANVCFNDGNGNWDSRNGANYRFTKGTYTYCNGTIKAR